MKIIIGMETSGETREAFRALGHDAWSCDLLPADDNSPFHIQGDVFEVVGKGEAWDIGIFHPTCTYLTGAGLHWNGRVPGRAEKTEAALQDVLRISELSIPKLVIENPVGCLSTRWRKPDQIIQPYEFGADASKKTCLWLKNLLPLVIDPSARCPGRWANGRERWANQTDSGQNRLAPSPTRWKERSKTYPEVAAAFARNWG